MNAGAESEYYFAYGSNLDCEQLRSRCRSARVVSRATLPGYVLAFGGHSRRWDGAVATVLRSVGGLVEGVLYAMNVADITTLDGFEGHPRSYSRVSRFVSLEDGQRRRAHVYIQPRAQWVSGPPSSEYLAVLRREYLEHGFDARSLALAANAGRTLPFSPAARVFVYGTLLFGEGSHHLLTRARWIGPARTEDGYTLHDLGHFPAMVKAGSSSIIGEVYDVDSRTLAAMDRLEGHPRFYRRALIVLADGMAAETYLLSEVRASACPRIESGNWRAYRGRQIEEDVG